MRIGVLTLPLHTNYGGILQAYALQTVLERMGHDVRVIDYDYLIPRPTYWKLFKRFVKTILGMQTLSVDYEKKLNEPEQIKRRYTQPFINKYIHRLPIKNIEEDLREEMFDCILVGSDQIWRPLYIEIVLGTSIPNAYLKFAERWNVKRIAYAASFGTDEWEYTKEETEIVKKLISKFDFVSVRELSGEELCRNYLGINVETVVDPTLLLNKKDYQQFIFKNKLSKKNYIYEYILDRTEEKDEIVKRIESMFGLEPLKVNIGENENSNREISQPEVEEWLQCFENAKYVITDSYHGSIFSIIFEKPFIVIGNEKRGMARFNSLLSMFDLKDRIISQIADIDKIKFNKLNTEIVEMYRSISMNFLLNSLK
ncbi:MAG: polysaccharide pyruvyl transferase family protein [Prevotella sp.]|nr:polysaccharide pyruvyl transferase family protein [Prevotella sp.]